MLTQCSQNPSVGLEASSRQLIWRLKMLDGRMYYVDGAVRSAGNDLQNVVADEWRCLKLERSSLLDTVALCCGITAGIGQDSAAERLRRIHQFTIRSVYPLSRRSLRRSVLSRHSEIFTSRQESDATDHCRLVPI